VHRIAFAACLAIVASLFVLVIGYGFEINAGGSALSPWLPPAGLVLLLSLGTLIWTLRKQAGNPLPLFRPRWPKQIPQPRQRADQAAYAADPQRLATCHHLQPVEGAMRRAGIRVKLLYGTAVEASCTIDESRLELPPPAVYYGNIPGDRQFDPPSASISCEEHISVIVVIHPDWATPGTPAFPAA
jgi:hypothetical protein